jgi:hypothetical protein
MSKGYVKDSKGKYRLVDKQEEPIVIDNQGPETQPLTLENVNGRLQKIESILSELMK